MIQSRHLRSGWRYLRHRFRAYHPYEVQAQLLNSCDRRCVFCRCPEVDSPLMTTAQWRTIILDLAGLGTIRVKFQGGEPTLRPDFREISAEAKKAGMITAVVTHGMHIACRPDLLDYLDEVVVSLDAPNPEVNDRLRGARAFDGAVGAVAQARAAGLRTYINMTVCKENYDMVEAMLEFCERRGLMLNMQPVKFGRMYYRDEARNLALTDGQIRSLHERIVSWKKQGRKLMFSAGAYKRALTWEDLTVLTVRSESNSRCICGRDYIHIEANGDVIPCIQHGAGLRPKNILRDGLREALRNVRDHDCGDCWTAYLNERKALFSFKPEAIRELFRRG
jgi:MoaA/NifB/PqqE/SkfB family radical SAM enzyme